MDREEEGTVGRGDGCDWCEGHGAAVVLCCCSVNVFGLTTLVSFFGKYVKLSTCICIGRLLSSEER